MNKNALRIIKSNNNTILKDSDVSNEIINTYFNENLGFGKFKKTAIDLLQLTINILNEFNISYCLISGTLLGYIRHNDFIPWDDDIDILIDDSIIKKISLIIDKYKNILSFMINGHHVKFCFKDKEKLLDCEWTKYLLNSDDKYNWPFIDLFIFTNENLETINFFGKSWIKNNFFPINIVSFLGMNVAIPNNPKYFLEINFSINYNNILVSSIWNHKDEQSIKNTIKISFNAYKKLLN
jgi:hypothetical protein